MMQHRRLMSFAVIAVVLFVGVAAPLVGSSRPAVARQEGRDLTTQELIGDALGEGEIDYETSLLYRAYALVGDPQLPEQFAAATGAEDHMVLNEVVGNWDRLSASAREQLEPYVVRPTNQKSIFAFNADDSVRTSGGSPVAANEASTNAAVQCVDEWATIDHPNYPIKVWMRCIDDYEADLQEVISLIDLFYDREVALMGPPKEDAGGPDGGGDSRIDLYVVDTPNDLLPREGGTVSPLTDVSAAMAISSEPFVGKTGSGFMIARRPAMETEGFRLDLAHEFFHILQYAHNVTITWGFSTTPYSGDFDVLRFTPYWFFEATPRWLESYMFRGDVSDSTMNRKVHGGFVNSFRTDLPLYTSALHGSALSYQMYAAYIYFYFMEQELGPEAIGQLWRNMENVDQDDFAGTLEAIDEVLPFDEHFRDFTVRNLNLDLEPGDPITPSYKDLDSSFPEGVSPVLAFGEGRERRIAAQQPGDEPRTIDLTINPLSARYVRIQPEDDVTGITLDFSDLAPNETLDLDLIVRITDKGWERRQLSVDGPTMLCDSVPDDAVDQFYLVLTNHGVGGDTTIDGSMTIDSSGAGCA